MIIKKTVLKDIQENDDVKFFCLKYDTFRGHWECRLFTHNFTLLLLMANPIKDLLKLPDYTASLWKKQKNKFWNIAKKWVLTFRIFTILALMGKSYQGKGIQMLLEEKLSQQICQVLESPVTPGLLTSLRGTQQWDMLLICNYIFFAGMMWVSCTKGSTCKDS